jgi:hypothetical protein
MDLSINANLNEAVSNQDSNPFANDEEFNTLALAFQAQVIYILQLTFLLDFES